MSGQLFEQLIGKKLFDPFTEKPIHKAWKEKYQEKERSDGYDQLLFSRNLDD